jgi:rubrerythrin
MNLDLLQFDPNPLESINRGGRKFTRYELDEEDSYEFGLDEAEWFCEECGQLVTDPDELTCTC